MIHTNKCRYYMSDPFCMSNKSWIMLTLALYKAGSAIPNIGFFEIPSWMNRHTKVFLKKLCLIIQSLIYLLFSHKTTFLLSWTWKWERKKLYEFLKMVFFVFRMVRSIVPLVLHVLQNQKLQQQQLLSQKLLPSLPPLLPQPPPTSVLTLQL